MFICMLLVTIVVCGSYFPSRAIDSKIRINTFAFPHSVDNSAETLLVRRGFDIIVLRLLWNGRTGELSLVSRWTYHQSWWNHIYLFLSDGVPPFR